MMRASAGYEMLLLTGDAGVRQPTRASGCTGSAQRKTFSIEDARTRVHCYEQQYSRFDAQSESN